MGDAFDSVGSKIDKSTEGVRKFSGAITGAVGAVTGIVGLVTTLVGLLAALAIKFANAAKEARQAQEAFDGAAKSTEQWGDAISDRLLPQSEQLNKRIDEEYISRIQALRKQYEDGSFTLQQYGEQVELLDEAFIKLVRDIGRIEAAEKRLESDRQQRHDAETARLKEQARLRNDLWSLGRDMDRYEREVDEENKRREIEQQRRVDAAAKARQDAVRDSQQYLRLLEEIARKQREINSLGLSGSAGNIGAAVNTVGASRVRKGP